VAVKATITAAATGVVPERIQRRLRSVMLLSPI